MTLSYLDRIESEAIYILREVVAQFKRPVLLYSIGKDSGCLLHLAAKAFYPAKIAFPLLHIDSTWEFKEAIEFRDWIIGQYGVELIVHRNEDGMWPIKRPTSYRQISSLTFPAARWRMMPS